MEVLKVESVSVEHKRKMGSSDVLCHISPFSSLSIVILISRDLVSVM